LTIINKNRVSSHSVVTSLRAEAGLVFSRRSLNDIRTNSTGTQYTTALAVSDCVVHLIVAIYDACRRI